MKAAITIEELAALTRDYMHNITKLSLRNSDLDFYSAQWRKDSLKKEIDGIEAHQAEIKNTLLELSPDIIFE